MLNVFIDCVGHPELFFSVWKLFEKRLGMKVYKPDGGLGWQVRSVRDITIHLQTKEEIVDGIKNITLEGGSIQRPISYEQFMEMDFDLLVITGWENEQPFVELAKLKKAKVIRHIANIHELPKQCKNILLSTLEPMPSGINWISYYPEHFDEFSYTEPKKVNKIKSFSNNLISYPQDMQVWNNLKKSLSGFEFFMHGALGEELELHRPKVPEATKDASFVFHMKAGCCGYIPRQAMAVGRPLLVNIDYCRIHNTIASKFLKDGINCIDMDPKRRPFDDVVKLIKMWAKLDFLKEKSKQIRRQFDLDVDFEQEALNIKKWIENLK